MPLMSLMAYYILKPVQHEALVRTLDKVRKQPQQSKPEVHGSKRQLETAPATPQISLILAVDIEFGVSVSNTEIRRVRYTGAAKVVRVR